MIVGIVGSEAAKFVPRTEAIARQIISDILERSGITGYSSGHCHIGGIDIWTEEIGNLFNLTPYIYPAEVLNWTGWHGQDGYKERNIKIAEKCDEIHCITLRKLPDTYTGMRFDFCYHCKTDTHVKSGGCWTAKYAQRLGKHAFWHVIE